MYIFTKNREAMGRTKSSSFILLLLTYLPLWKMKAYLSLFVILICFVCIIFIYLGFKGQSENLRANGITMDYTKEAKPHCNCGVEVLTVIQINLFVNIRDARST